MIFVLDVGSFRWLAELLRMQVRLRALCIQSHFWMVPNLSTRLCSPQAVHEDRVLHLLCYPLSHRPREVTRGTKEPRATQEARQTGAYCSIGCLKTSEESDISVVVIFMTHLQSFLGFWYMSGMCCGPGLGSTVAYREISARPLSRVEPVRFHAM